MRRLLLLASLLAALAAAPTASAWTWPADGPVLSTFSFDRAPPYAAGQRRGIDIGADPGAGVVAPAGGTISFAGSVPGSGRSVTIQTADGYSVTLTQLGSIGAMKGTSVAEGAQLGSVGSNASMHLGIRITADAQGYLDPLSFLPPRVAAPILAVPDPAAGPAPAPAPSADVASGPADVQPVAGATAEPPAAEATPTPVTSVVADPPPAVTAAEPPVVESTPAPVTNAAPDSTPAAVPDSTLAAEPS